MRLNNNYFLLRHGEAISNKKDVVSSWPEKFHNPLTAIGKQQIKLAAESLKNEKIDLIFASDLLRTKMSAEIIAKKLKVVPKFDKRLREYNVGIYNGVPVSSYWEKFQGFKNRFRIKAKNGESYANMSDRVCGFLKEINKKYKGKNILIISHQLAIFFLIGKIKDLPREELLREYIFKETSIPTGTLVKINAKNKNDKSS